MRPQDLAKEIGDAVSKADQRFAASILKVQSDLYSQLLTSLKGLDLDQDGYIMQNGNNRKILSEAEDIVSQVFRDPYYVGAVSNYLSVIPKIDALNEKYFESVSSSFKPNRVFIKSLQQQTIQTVEKYILQDGLESQVIDPLISILNQNINAGGKFSGFLEQVRTYIEGNSDVDGRALRYSRVYLKNELFKYARAYQQSVTADLKLEWYLYSGGLIDKSREFCIKRAGNYYHYTEIESWASLDWAGKDALTTESSIFILLGGHGCIHTAIPVSKSIVPAADLARFE